MAHASLRSLPQTCLPQPASQRLKVQRVICSAAPVGGPPPVDPSIRTALVTGGNTGIGYCTARSLAQQGYHTVLACRSREKAEAAREKIKAEVPGAKVEVVVFDLADLQSVRDWANRAQDFGHPLSVLCNNAGVMAPPRMETADGFELQLGVNHLGHFLLTNMLLPLLTKSEKPGRIVNVSSTAHFFGHINFDDINSERSYSRWGAYGQSKLANILFTRELAKRLGTAATANSLHPGVVNTELQRYLLPESVPAWQKPFFHFTAKFLLTPEEGAKTSIYLASSPEVEGVTGKYWDKCKPATSSAESYNDDVARRLWDLSAELVKL